MVIYWKWIIKSLPGVILGALMWASQVTPQQVNSNIASWLIFFGIKELPPWVRSESIDQYAFSIGLIGLVGWGGWLLTKLISRTNRQEENGDEFIAPPIPSPQPITKTTEETENERFHDQRKGSLKIDFANDYSFKSIGPSEGHGISEGRWQKYRVEVRNTTGEDIRGVQVWLEGITPMPPELMGHGGLPLHITHEAEGVSVIALRAHEKRGVDVVSYFDKFWQVHIRIHHTAAAKQEIYDGETWNDGSDAGYQIELVAKGDKVDPFSRRFKIGVKNRDLYMVSLDQSEEEAMIETYRNT